MPQAAEQFGSPFRFDGTFLFQRILVRRNFGNVSFRLYLGHGRHNFWFLSFWFAIHSRSAFCSTLGNRSTRRNVPPSTSIKPRPQVERRSGWSLRRIQSARSFFLMGPDTGAL
jgi:hypothetical protein